MFSFKRSLIALGGMLVIVGTLATLMPLVSRGQGGNPFNRDTRKSYYLTQTTHNGSQPLTACAAGYHMASLWEIFDTSNLKYDTALGLTTADSGLGPPHVAGWIRTGSVTAETGNVAGIGNCNAWMSADANDFGTEVRLPVFWNFTSATDISPWDAAVIRCNAPIHVWCVQD
jgi:hypothetical protein